MAGLAEYFFYLQFISAIILGGLIGEYYRTVMNNGAIDRKFFAKFLAGAFLTFLLDLAIYQATGNKVLVVIVGGILSYQEESFIMKIATSFLKKNLPKDDEEE